MGAASVLRKTPTSVAAKTVSGRGRVELERVHADEHAGRVDDLGPNRIPVVPPSVVFHRKPGSPAIAWVRPARPR